MKKRACAVYTLASGICADVKRVYGPSLRGLIVEEERTVYWPTSPDLTNKQK